METAPQDTTEPNRFVWRAVSRTAADIDTIVVEAESVASDLPTLLADVRADESGTPVAVRRASAAQMSDAAARLRHAALRLEVAATELVLHEDAHLADGFRTPRTWLAHHAGLSRGEATALCRAAETCEQFPEVAVAFHTGAMTTGHVDAVSRIIPTRFTGATREDAIRKVVDVQGILVDTAGETSVPEFTDFCARVRDRLDADGPRDPAAESSKVWLHQVFNGRWALSGDLSPDDGAIVNTILEDIRARQVAAERAANGAAGANAEAAPITASELRATDLLELLRRGIADGRPGRVGLFLHIDLDDLHPPAPSGPEGSFDAEVLELLDGRRPAHTEAGLDVSLRTLWGLLADADVTPVFTKDGRSLSFGRTERLTPPILRRVLAHRDRTCRWPGCDRSPIWHQGHHVEHWGDGGETDPATCCGLCSFHHHAHHDRGFGVCGDAETGLTITRPDGSPLDTRPRYLGSAHDSERDVDPPASDRDPPDQQVAS